MNNYYCWLFRHLCWEIATWMPSFRIFVLRINMYSPSIKYRTGSSLWRFQKLLCNGNTWIMGWNIYSLFSFLSSWDQIYTLPFSRMQLPDYLIVGLCSHLDKVVAWPIETGVLSWRSRSSPLWEHLSFSSPQAFTVTYVF